MDNIFGNDNDLVVGQDAISFDDLGAPVISGEVTIVEDTEQYVKKADIESGFESPEERKKFIKSLNPEVKADMTYKNLVQSGIIREVYGHEKRILMRKLVRQAKDGKLDKYFLQK